jgi:L-ascorbate metabolism protein UlaG (beta-lactamase superfamily)
VSLEIDFIGHATLLIELDGVRVLTDPATRARIGPLRRVVPVPDPHRLIDLDLIVVSHLHWDHLDLPSLRDRGTTTPIVVPVGAGSWLRSQGFDDVRELPVGARVEVGSIVVEAMPARHSGRRPPNGPSAATIGFVLRGSRSIYFAGDTDLFDEMAGLASPRLDVALLPVWGWGPTLGRGQHLDPASAAEAVRRIRPRTAVPIHWGTYWPVAMGRVLPARLTEPPAAFAEHVRELAPDVRVLLTEVGERVALPRG